MYKVTGLVKKWKEPLLKDQGGDMEKLYVDTEPQMKTRLCP